MAQALLSLDHPDKKIVLLDECTSNLDAETEAVVPNNIWPLLEGKTVIVVTHRLSAIDGLVDEVVAFSEGRVAGRYAGEELSAFAVQPFAVPIA